MPDVSLSTGAMRLLAALREHGATARASALTHAQVAELIHVPVREIVDLAAEITARGTGLFVLAHCGKPPGIWLGTRAETIEYIRVQGRRKRAIGYRCGLYAAALRRHDLSRRCGQLDLFSEAPR